MEEEKLGLIIRRIFHAIKKEMDNNLKRLDLTMSQGLVLEYLNNTPDEELTQKAIEQHFDLQHPTVSGILKRLERNGFITMSVNKIDRRVKDIFLTEKSAGKFELQAREDKRLMEQMLMKDLSQEEVDTLRSLLKRVLHNMAGD